MVERGSGARLLFEPSQRVDRRSLGPKDLQRDGPIQPGIASAINLAHASRPERREDFIRPDANSGFQ